MVTDSLQRKRSTAPAIADDLERQIRAGAFSQGSLLPTERELQESFAACRSTVRKALSILVERGLATPIPNRGTVVGRLESRPRSSHIAFIDGPSYVLRNLFTRIGSHLREMGFLLIHMESFGNGAKTVEECLEYAAENSFAGALVWPFEGFPDAERIRKAQEVLPIVCLDHRLRGVETDLSAFDGCAAGRIAAEHLARQGRKRIGVCGVMDMLETNHDRFTGYLEGVWKSGLVPKPSDFLFTDFSLKDGYDMRMTLERFRMDDRPDALVVLQDDHVPALVDGLISLGLRIPEDVALVAIGDDLALNFNGNGLTSVGIDWESVSMNAVKLLHSRLVHPTAPIQELHAPIDLRVRGLCGAPKSAWTRELDEPSSPYHAIEQQNPKLLIRLITHVGQSSRGGSRTLNAETIK